MHGDDDDRGSIISIIEDRARSSNRSFLLRCQVSPGSEGHRLGGRPRPQWPIGHPQTIRPVTPLGFQGLSWLLARASKLKGRKPKLKNPNFKICYNSARCAMLKSIFVATMKWNWGVWNASSRINPNKAIKNLHLSASHVAPWSWCACIPDELRAIAQLSEI